MDKMFHFSEYLLKKYQMHLQRIPIDLALGCPNRDGGGFGNGCIFCSENGARARHLSRTGLDLAQQVREGREYVAKRYPDCGGYIAYFQSFTSTFAPAARLRELYEKVLAEADFKVLIVSTRPDALADDVVEYLSELAQRYELFVELGIQSANDRTLQEINRGHDAASVLHACEKLHKANIQIAGHFILGLPGETADDWMNTARFAAQLPLTAVKMHQLMILKNTVLARRFSANPDYVKPLNEYEYAAGLKDFLRELPENTLLMRLMADAGENDLIAPRWWMKKGQFLSFFNDYFYNKQSSGSFMPTKTADGSFTLYHPGYRQHFHTLAGAGSEAEKKFAEPSQLVEKLRLAAAEKRPLRLLDVGFGLGTNAFSAVMAARSVPEAQLEIISLENDERTLTAAAALFGDDAWQKRALLELVKTHQTRIGNAEIKLMLADGRISVQKLPDKYIDLIWLDAFSCDVNPELWSWQFLRECARLMRSEDSLLLTYSSAPSVRGALFKAGFEVGETPSFGRKRSGTVAALSLPEFCPALPEKEKHIIFDSTAGTPYSDPGLNNSGKFMQQYRKKLVEKLRRHGIPKWYKA